MILEGYKGFKLTHGWIRKVIELRRLLLIAIPVGAISGAGVAGLEYLCNGVLWNHINEWPLFWKLLSPIVGLLISGFLVSKLGLNSVGMLNEVVVHYHAPPESVSLKEDSVKFAACVATVGLGASAGLGGPSQWLGARIAYHLRFAFSEKWKVIRGVTAQHTILIGAAAGVSAVFRAPLTGTLLALETPFSKDIEGTALLPASIAAYVAHITHGLLLNNEPLLPFPHFESGAHFGNTVLASITIGVATGLISRRFQRALSAFKRLMSDYTPVKKSLIGGVLTSATAYIAYLKFRETWTLQAGLPLAKTIFAGEYTGWKAALLLILKIAAVCFTMGTTGVAGLLVVTLTVGSLIGAAIFPLVPGLDLQTTTAIAVCSYLAANYNAPLAGIALAAEWGGTGLLPEAWLSVVIAAWVGEGLANTPAKLRIRHKFFKTTNEEEKPQI